MTFAIYETETACLKTKKYFFHRIAETLLKASGVTDFATIVFLDLKTCEKWFPVKFTDEK